MLNETIRQMIITEIEKILPVNDNDNLISAMRYMLLASAKYIRPFLVISSALIFGVKIQKILPIAVAVEFVHTYSLIHDDLPCMDDSNFRRNQLSCHQKFNESTAILAGDALLTLAFETLSSLDNDYSCKIIKILSQEIGHKGMIRGQILDIENKGKSKDMNFYDIQNINLLKTAKLFAASCKIGAVVGNATSEQSKALYDYGINLGLIFQIKDDIKDYKEDYINNQLDKLTLKNYVEDLYIKASDNLHLFPYGTDQLRSLLIWVKNND